MPNPVTDEEKQRMRDLHSQGSTRNDIAREIGRSMSTVTVHCRKMGLGFDREPTKAATDARQADMRSWRTDKLSELAEKIDAELRRWTRPYMMASIGGRENTYTEHVVESGPTAEVRFTMARTIAVLMEQHLKIAAFDAAKDDHGVSDVDAWLESMTAGAGH